MFKLLVVDDELDARDTLSHCFPWESVGFTIVKQADHGKEALDYLLEHEVHVVLCDIRMPIMNGIELARRIHERNLPVRIVLLSAYREFEYAQEAMRYGVREYIVKPAKYDDIVHVFTRLRDELERSADAAPAANPAERALPHWPDGLDDPVILRIAELVHRHLQTVTLQQAAEFVDMNASYLSTYFKKKTGVNFSDYVLKVRMEKAAELLAQNRLKAYEVSESVGYGNPKNFMRSFKQYYGMTPGQYKNER